MSIIVNNWRMDSSLNALIHCSSGEVRRLGEYHFILLETLVNNADTVLSRSYLMSEVWKNRVVGGNSLPTAIHALRTAIDDNGKQQEIIKTIPKKGYLFNKNYISIVEDDEKTDIDIPNESTDVIFMPEESMVVNAPEESNNIASDASFSATDNAETSSTGKTEKHVVAKKHSHKMLLTALPFLIIAFFLFALTYYIAPSDTTSDAPMVIKESMDNAERVSIYHLSSKDTNKQTTSLLSQHINTGIVNVNQLLTQRNASMDLYYKISINRMNINVILKNACNNSWQLALRFDSWQKKDADMNTILFQEVEKMLNEMPSCK